jgi:hypothetical protein
MKTNRGMVLFTSCIFTVAFCMSSCGEYESDDGTALEREAQSACPPGHGEVSKVVLQSNGTYAGYHCCSADWCAKNDPTFGVTCTIGPFAGKTCKDGTWIGNPSSPYSQCPYSGESSKRVLQSNGTYAGYHCCSADWCAKNDPTFGVTCTIGPFAGKTCKDGAWIGNPTSPYSQCPSSGEISKRVLQSNGTYVGYHCCSADWCAKNDPTWGVTCTIGSFASMRCVDGSWYTY